MPRKLLGVDLITGQQEQERQAEQGIRIVNVIDWLPGSDGRLAARGVAMPASHGVSFGKSA